MKEAQPLPQLHREMIRATAGGKSSTRRGESSRGSIAAMDMRSAPRVPNVSKRPSTAPAAGAAPSEKPYVGVDRGIQGSTNELTACDGPVNASRHHDAGRSVNDSDNLRSTGSAWCSQRSGGSGGRSGGGSFTHPPSDTHEEHTREEPPPHRNSELATAPGIAAEIITENAFETEHDLISYVSLGPATAEATRRPTIEADATLSRSPRVLVSPTSIWPRSEGVFTALSGTTIGNGGGSQEIDDEGRRNSANFAEKYLETTEARAEIDTAGNISLVKWNGMSINGGAGSMKRRGAGGDSGRSPNKQAMKHGNLRKGGGAPGLHHQQRHQGEMASTSRSGSIYTTSRITEGDLSGPSVSSPAARARATGTTWTEWSRPGERGELDVQADTSYGTNGRGRRYAPGRARNGAATGAGWGGYDQVRQQEKTRRV